MASLAASDHDHDQVRFDVSLSRGWITWEVALALDPAWTLATAPILPLACLGVIPTLSLPPWRGVIPTLALPLGCNSVPGGHDEACLQ